MIHINKTLLNKAAPGAVRFSQVLFECLQEFNILCGKMMPGPNYRIGKQVEKGKPE